MRVRLYRVILPVDDIGQAEQFYTELLGIVGERVSPGRHYFNCGGTILACYDPVADGDGKGDGWRHHFNQYFYFAVEDLETVLERAKRLGCQALSEAIEDMPWGERLFYARDPFGNPICLVDERTLYTGN
jgi:predicted enzyme related to lactoylglutathione lyase